MALDTLQNPSDPVSHLQNENDAYSTCLRIVARIEWDEVSFIRHLTEHWTYSMLVVEFILLVYSVHNLLI